MAGAIIVGVDTGGTFTDLVAVVDGRLKVHKVLSTPEDPAAAVIDGIRSLLGGARAELVTYSSTVATNALLEKKGARVALITNAGFEDLIEIGRQNRTELYALAPRRPEPLVSRRLRFGARERTLFDGRIVERLDHAELRKIRAFAAQSGAEAFAVCLLHSYANARSEEAIARALNQLGRAVSVSSRLLAEYREFERFSTTVLNAYVGPRMERHLGELSRRIPSKRLRVMQSDGNAISTNRARLEPVRTILSGPAAGVAGAAAIARGFGVDRFITFDMGGTSTDVSLFDRRARIRTLTYPGGYAVRTPAIDIHTVGAGGGSIARVDAGGSLKVGPESAGANPGPACYGRGNEPTVTDADLIAGRLVADRFLGGAMKLHHGRANAAIARLARSMRSDVSRAALGVIRVVNANMERAIRVISIERGFDPRDFALLAFGGAGPMHASELALELGIRHVIMPRNPGLLCAYGALCARVGREYSRTVRVTDAPHRRLLEISAPMVARARAELAAEGARSAGIQTALRVDARYRGQSYELEVPLHAGFVKDFHRAHSRTFGYTAPDAPVEVVNLRVRARASEYAPRLERIGRSRSHPARASRASAIVDGKLRRIPMYARDDLSAGSRLRGPALITELSSTAYVAPQFRLEVDDYGNIHLETR